MRTEKEIRDQIEVYYSTITNLSKDYKKNKYSRVARNLISAKIKELEWVLK
jgi:hypothetical protein